MSISECLATTVDDWSKQGLPIQNALGRKYLFRGQAASRWPLSTRLERDLELLCDASALPQIAENNILDRFRRRARFYTGFELRDPLEWLALLQHHGGPTRLLDVTRSFFVAVFFAIDGAREDVAVWAFQEIGTIKGSDEALKENFNQFANPKYRVETSKYANNLLAQVWKTEATSRELETQDAPKAVLVLEPDALFDRLAVQQGLFLFPVNLQASFEQNLASTFRWRAISPKKVSFEEFLKALKRREVGVAKITIKRSTFPSIARDLYAMNVTAATIYPGLDGFAKSLSPLFGPQQYDRDDFH